MPERTKPPVPTGGRTEQTAGNRSQFDYAAAARSCQPRHGQVLDGVWVKSVRASAHMLRRPRGWCLDAQDALAAWRRSAQWVVLRDLETGCEYWAKIQVVLENGKLIDRGCGQQLFWPLERWAPDKTAAEALARSADETQASNSRCGQGAADERPL